MIMVDIDMPKNCYECDFNGGEYGPDYPEKCSCKLTGRGMSKKDYKKRPKDCPLKNITGRLTAPVQTKGDKDAG